MRLFTFLSLFGLGCATATQELYEWKKYHNYRRRIGHGATTERSEHSSGMKALHNQHMNHQTEHLQDIPESFEVRGDNAKKDFLKYVEDIQDLAQKQNIKITYKVSIVEATQNEPPVSKRSGNGKSKKHGNKRSNNNLKLSPREIALSKLGEFPEPFIRSSVQSQPRKTTTATTKEPLLVKYKPTFSQIKLNFKKRVKPVKLSVITLNKENTM